MFSDESLTFIAEQAVERGTGARGLRGILETLLCDTMFEAPKIDGLIRCEVVVVEDQDVPDRNKLEITKVVSPESHTSAGVNQERSSLSASVI